MRPEEMVERLRELGFEVTPPAPKLARATVVLAFTGEEDEVEHVANYLINDLRRKHPELSIGTTSRRDGIGTGSWEVTPA